MPSFCSLLLNDTASTAIYTYLHTLSLHDALPILWLLHRLQLLPGGGDLPRHQGTGDPRHGGIGAGGRARAGVSRTGGDRLGRSEEHTSELQSLMRNSYAVFCLKKKKDITTRRTSLIHSEMIHGKLERNSTT